MKVFNDLPIMVVEDDLEVGKSITRDLRVLGEVLFFQSTEEALKALKYEQFSVILSDLNMAPMNGLQFLAKCAEIQPLAQRILITAYADLANIFESINEARLNFIFAKPWEPEALRKSVLAAVEANRILRENFELRKMAWTDGLTGLANHRYFWERLESEFSRAQRFSRPLSLIMCDVDDFKAINDKFGHAKGDETLRSIASALEKNKRNMDVVARYGGEEFAIILPEVNLEQALEIASRHLNAVVNQSGVGLSLGVATFPEGAQSPSELLDLADRALYLAKHSGKRQVKSYKELANKKS
jgi:diguanylate cyclase (GGDEF)-like protein